MRNLFWNWGSGWFPLTQRSSKCSYSPGVSQGVWSIEASSVSSSSLIFRFHCSKRGEQRQEMLIKVLDFWSRLTLLLCWQWLPFHHMEVPALVVMGCRVAWFSNTCIICCGNILLSLVFYIYDLFVLNKCIIDWCVTYAKSCKYSQSS